MKSFLTSPTRLFLFGSLFLVFVTALAIRLTPTPVPVLSPSPTSMKTTATTSSGVGGIPAFTSASFETGDALGSLGPEWTLVQQDPHPAEMALALAGVRATRDTLAHLLNASSSLRIIELQITDTKALHQSLGQKSMKTRVVAGRTGYIVPEVSLTGGSAFMLVGTSTAVMLEYAIDPFQNFLEWPTEVPAAVQAYISAVKMY